MFHGPANKAVDIASMGEDEGLIELDLFREPLLSRQSRLIPRQRYTKRLAKTVEAFPKERLFIAEMPEDRCSGNFGVGRDLRNRRVVVAAREKKLRRSGQNTLLGRSLAGQRLRNRFCRGLANRR